MGLTVDQAGKSGGAGGALSVNGTNQDANKLLSPVYDMLTNKDNYDIDSTGAATLKVNTIQQLNQYSTAHYAQFQKFNHLPPSAIDNLVSDVYLYLNCEDSDHIESFQPILLATAMKEYSDRVDPIPNVTQYAEVQNPHGEGNIEGSTTGPLYPADFILVSAVGTNNMGQADDVYKQVIADTTAELRNHSTVLSQVYSEGGGLQNAPAPWMVNAFSHLSQSAGISWLFAQDQTPAPELTQDISDDLAKYINY